MLEKKKSFGKPKANNLVHKNDLYSILTPLKFNNIFVDL
jgi:hypothetical protein